MGSPSVIDIIAEELRQEATGDANFYRTLPYMFKLVCPRPNIGPTGDTGQALFPLPINPDTLTYEWPYSGQATPMQDAGVVTDEAGIVIARIHLEGTTGFKLRPNRDTSTGPGDQRFAGLLPSTEIKPAGRIGHAFGVDNISGQMALWRLLGRCFDAYSELKKDPAIGPLTRMEFHNQRDRIHLEVRPTTVRILRDVGKNRLTYRYSIDLEAYGPADEHLFFIDDDDALDIFDNVIASIRKAVQTIQATIDDCTAALDAIRRRVSNIVSILDDFKNVVAATNDFLDGTRRFTAIEQQLFSSLADLAETAAELVEDDGGGTGGTWIVDDWLQVAYSLKDGADAVDAINVATLAYRRQQWDEIAESTIKAQRRWSNLTEAQKEAIDSLASDGDDAQGTMSLYQAFGENYRPGDRTRRKSTDQEPSISVGQYQGFVEVRIQQGDTLESIAIKYVGTAAAARDIAIINDLRPPYIMTGTRVPNTLAPGDPIVVPVTQVGLKSRILTSGQADQQKSQLTAFLGTDIRLIKLSTDQYGWDIDTAHGSEDCRLAVGPDNIIQSVEGRLRTEQGDDKTWPSIGLPRLVGVAGRNQRYAAARYAFEQQLLADPRIEHVEQIRFLVELDTITATVYAYIGGIESARPIPLTLT